MQNSDTNNNIPVFKKWSGWYSLVLSTLIVLIAAFLRNHVVFSII